MTIGVVTNDSAMRGAVAVSLAMVTLPWAIYPSVAALTGHHIDVVLWDERQYTDDLLDQLTHRCPRIICVLPRAERRVQMRTLRFGPLRAPYTPLWFHIVPGEPDEYVILVNNILNAPTETLLRQWADWRAARQTSQHGNA